jgi:competence protein ComEC
MNRTLGHRAPLLWIVLPFLAGLAAGRAGLPAPLAGLLGCALILAALSTWGAWVGHRGWGAMLAVAMFLAGDVSHALHRRHLPERERLPPREAELELTVERLFASRRPDRLVGLTRVADAPPHLRDLRGQRLYVAVALPAGMAGPIVSARLRAVGVLTPLPAAVAAGSFDGYLADSGVNFRLERGRVVAELAPANAYRRFCAAAAARFEAILSAGTGRRPELGGAFRAMVLGRQQELDDEQVREFRLSGTMHIFSISGMHIAVIALALQTALAALRLPLLPRTALELAGLWLYVDITGTAPSAVRAFVMVALVRVAFVLRRPLNPLAALTASMAAVLLAAPLQVFSASFQMSYGIVAALFLLGLPLDEAWRERGEPFQLLPRADWRWWHHEGRRLWSWLRAAVAIGLSSALVGTITGLHFFGLFTPGAMLVNLALIPLSTAVIWAGLLSLLTGLTGLEAWSELFNRAALVLLWLSEQAIAVALRLPAMWFEGRFVRPWLGEAALVALLAFLLTGYARGWPRKWGGFWPPFAFVALVLLLGVKFGG